MALRAPALAVLELESLARGIVVTDALLKQAQGVVAIAGPVSPGKYLLVFVGEVAEVEESFAAGIESAGAALLDRLMLTYVHDGVVAALQGDAPGREADEALGVVETQTVAATLKAADAGLKRAQVKLVQLQLARGIGGKGWFTLTGEQHDVESALEAAAAAIEPSLLVATELINAPHHELGHARQPANVTR